MLIGIALAISGSTIQRADPSPAIATAARGKRDMKSVRRLTEVIFCSIFRQFQETEKTDTTRRFFCDPANNVNF